jgi:ATP-dependent DNA helicase RecG
MKLDALGIPTNKLNQFKAKDILTVEDLAKYFPRKYHDFRVPTTVREAKDGDMVAIVGVVQDIRNFVKYVKAKVYDGTGTLEITWFNSPHITNFVFNGDTYIFCGKITADYRTKGMMNPPYYSKDIDMYKKLLPVYGKIKGMSDEYLTKSITQALTILMNQEHFEPQLVAKFGLMKASGAYKSIHQPQDEQELEKAKERFMFEDLFEFAMQMAEGESSGEKKSPFIMRSFAEVTTFLGKLPFELTDGQREALRTMSLKMKHGDRVNALVQGDVGCGKTIVAILMMILASANGYQSVLMAPTNVLARQHYADLLEKTKDMPYEVAFLSGDMKAKERREVLKKLSNGEIHMIIGTHAVLSEDVKIPNLALTIVDEEHRFGVEQRNILREKAKQGVHHMNMSATPIPRSLALSMYGDQIDVLTIKTLPKGRKPIRTVVLTEEGRALNGIFQQIEKGHQCYVVCPLIEDSENEVLQDVESVETTFEKMSKHFASKPEVKIAMISGRMKSEEVNFELERFTRNETNILISTTIIEVGVNVPNSTMIVVKNAERFGLAQLHQLRGRVGRGDYESFCVLLSEKDNNPKLHAMRDTTDGFRIAEIDLNLRGMGDFIGTRQSGQSKYVMLMIANQDLYRQIKEEVRIIRQDPKRLSNYRYLNILNYEEGA